MKKTFIVVVALSFAAFASPCLAAGDKGDVGRYVFGMYPLTASKP